MRRRDIVRRKFYIDLLRMVALFHMIFQHGAMILLKKAEFTEGIEFLYQIIPICPALFLFLSGYSLTISGKISIDRQKFLRNIKRGVLLVLAGMLLFLFEHGVQLPDLLFNSGILSTIGFMLIVCSLIMYSPFTRLWAVLLTALSTGLYLFLDLKGIEILPFNSGYEPLLPTIIFGFIGFLLGIVLTGLNRKNRGALIALLTVCGGGVLGYLFYQYGPFKALYVEVTTHIITRLFSVEGQLPYLLFGGESGGGHYSASVYNYSTTTFLAALSLLLLLFGAAYYLERGMKRFLPSFLLLPGRHALVNYFFHLALFVAVASIVGFKTLNRDVFLIVLFAVFLLTYGISLSIEAVKALLRKRRLLLTGRRALRLRRQAR